MPFRFSLGLQICPSYVSDGRTCSCQLSCSAEGHHDKASLMLWLEKAATAEGGQIGHCQHAIPTLFLTLCAPTSNDRGKRLCATHPRRLNRPVVKIICRPSQPMGRSKGTANMPNHMTFPPILGPPKFVYPSFNPQADWFFQHRRAPWCASQQPRRACR